MYNQLHCTCDNIKTALLNDFKTITNDNIYVPQQININKEPYETRYVLMEKDVLFRKAKKIARLTEDVVQDQFIKNFDITLGRTHLVEIITAIRCNVIIKKEEVEENVIEDILRYLESLMALYSIKKLDHKILSRIVSGNTDTVSSQYFHLYLDLQWLVLTISYLCRKRKNILNVIQRNIMNNLIYLAHYMYDVKSVRDTPFICTCIQTFWISFEYFIWKVWNSETEFWLLYNNLINDYDLTFCMWLMQKIIVENNIKRCNYSLIDLKLKSLLREECQEHKLLDLLHTLKPILNKVWLENAKIDPYLCLWDYFFKNLNVLSTDYPNKLVQFIKFVDVVEERKEFNSYQLFINMLLCHLKEHPAHWAKLKGRIYSRLPAHKMEDFTRKGIFNISLFFLALTEVNFEESSKKLFELMSPIQKNNSELLAMIYMTLVSSSSMFNSTKSS